MTIDTLEDKLSEPIAADIEAMRRIAGDIIVLGAGGKMGPSLVRLARRASEAAGVRRRVIPVTRSGDPSDPDAIACDMLDRAQLARLPDAPNVVFLAGRKFGSVDNQALTWATNVLLPGMAAERYRGSRIVALSSGNIYPLVAKPATEQTPPGPVGEYAQSVLGRERAFEYYSARDQTPVALIRLNYANDLRYGVLLDIGQHVAEGRPVALATGRVNVIWQRDANSVCLRALEFAASPPLVLNLTGPETLSVRYIAQRFGFLLGRDPIFEGTEAQTALLNDSTRCWQLLGPQTVSADQLIDMTAEWIREGGPTLNKPTHFEVRDGIF